MAKKKIRTFDNWKSTLQWIATVMSILIVLFFAIDHKSMMPLKSVHVEIKSASDQKPIITEEIVLNKLNTYLGYDVESANIEDLNLVEVEHLIKSDNRVKHAEVYIDAAERIHIEIDQRVPAVRVFSDNGESFYIGTDGVRINRVKGIAARVPVATGNLSSYDETFLTEDYTGTLKEVYELAIKIKGDKFLSALIEQIYVDELDEMILIPKLGGEELAFGSIEDSDAKLENIKEYYQTTQSKVGWNKYQRLTFKYKGKDGKGLLFAEK